MPFGLLDARASFAFAKAPVTQSIYALNLTNQKYITAAGAFLPPSLGWTINWLGPLLTFGGSLKYSF